MTTSLHDIPGEHVACIPFREHAAATTDETAYCFVLPFKAKVSDISVVFDANITGADSNSTDFVVGYEVGGEFTTFKATSFVSGTNATAGAANDYTPASETILEAGTMIAVVWEKVGNGLKIPTGLLIIKYVGA